MKTPVLKSYSPGIQLLVFFGIIFISLFVFSLIGSGLCNALYGVNMLDPEALSDPTADGVMESQRILMVVNQIGFFLVPALIFGLLSSHREEHFFKAYQVPSFWVFLLIPVIVISSQAPINWMLQLNQSIALPENLVEMEKSAEQLIDVLLGTGSNADLFISLVIFALIPAIAEEFFFRGVIQQTFERSFRNQHMAVWMTAFVFSFIHMQFLGFLPRFVLGAVLGYVFVWTGNLFSSILLHFLNNALGIVLMILIKNGSITADANQTGTQQGQWPFLILSTIILIAALWLLHKKSAALLQRSAEVNE